MLSLRLVGGGAFFFVSRVSVIRVRNDLLTGGMRFEHNAHIHNAHI